MSVTIEQVVTRLPGGNHAESSSCGLGWTSRSSACDERSRDRSSSERHSESHRRPKEFSGKEEDFQQWLKKTEAFFAGVVKESEMMLEWSAEQVTQITRELIDLQLLPTSTKVERGVRNLDFVLQMHTALTALTSCESNDIVANSRKNPLAAWRRLQKRYDPTAGM